MVEIEKLGSDLTLDEYIHGYSSPSQRAFEESQAFQTVLIGGVGSGKNHSFNKRAVLLSFLEPGNEGMICRYRATELETTTRHQFFEEVPACMILDYNKSEDYVLIRSGQAGNPSKIWFRALWEPRPDKKRHAGMNLGWIGVDQLEDVEEMRWTDIMARFRRRTVRRPYMFGILNPKGHDWIWKRWIKPAESSANIESVLVPSVSGGYVESVRYRADTGVFAIVAKTEENFFNGRCDEHRTPQIGCEACRLAAAAYVQRLRRYNPPEWVRRMVDAGFNELRGAVYPEYNEYSVHNIDPFPIPDSWETIVPIDCGGDSPWAIPVMRVDPQGDVYIVSEFFEPSVLIQRIAGWLKDPQQSLIPDLDRARKIIDPENKSAALELTQHGIYCEAAGKGAKKPGIYRVAGYMHRMPGRVKVMPMQVLPDGTSGALTVTDAPRLWVFKTCPNWRREHDAWQWGRDLSTGEPTDEPVDRDDHTCDSTLYGMRILPPVWDLPEVDPALEALKRLHYPSYVEALHRDEAAGKGKPSVGLGEMLTDEPASWRDKEETGLWTDGW